MSRFDGILRIQVESLLDALRRQKDSRCRELSAAARARADALLRRSRQELRERGRHAVDRERKRRDLALRQARHRTRAAESQNVQALHAALLGRAWPQLIAELERRWGVAASCKSWCEMLLREAQSALGPETWTIEHPVGWSDGGWFVSVMRQRGLPEPLLRADAQIVAGLRIFSGTACVDGTIDGLLSRRSRLEGRLLAAWEREAQHG